MENGEEFAVGAELTVELFNETKKVDVTGTSKGKGFQGAVKRWNFRTQDMTHGNSLSHRAPGSITNVKLQVAYLKARKWQVTWVLSV